MGLARKNPVLKLNKTAFAFQQDAVNLIKDKEYTISTDGFITITKPVTTGQILKVYEYETTDGCWVPPTPTKLGLYPKYQPQIFLDDVFFGGYDELAKNAKFDYLKSFK